MRFTRAIVRPPSRNFAAGLTAAAEGPPDVDLALEQHAAYCQALRDRGLDVIQLQPDEAHPDATFVEDTAIVTERGAVITRPGAASRRGEVASVAQCLGRCYPDEHAIGAPGTVDGGDICEADGHFLIGVSARTNQHGAEQLAGHLGRWGYASSIIDIRTKAGLLHLKSGIAYLGESLWVADRAIEADLRSCKACDRASRIVIVPPAEAYAANCVRVNDAVFVATGYPLLRAALEARACRVVQIDVSEFRKMDGGLSCLSLRF